MAAIHEAITKAMAEIAKTGIAKTSKASMGGSTVWFRGIEAAMNEMSGVLIRCGITVTPSYQELSVTERARAEAGKFTRFCTLRGEFTFSAADGSSVTSSVYGEAMDSGDKAVVKAQSVAFRTALFQQFVIPTMAIDPETHGDDDGNDGPAADAVAAAEKGMAAYEAFWKGLDAKARRALGNHHAELKAIAAEADAAGAVQ